MMAIPWKHILPNGGRAFIGGGACVPFALIDDLLANAGQFRDVELVHIHTFGKTPWIDASYEGAFRTNSFFLTESISQAVSEGRADYTPAPISEIARLFTTETLPLDVALIQCSPPDAQGMVSLGLSVDVIKSALNACKTIVAQVNTHLPHIGGEALFPLEKIDFMLDHAAPLEVKENWIYDKKLKKMAKYAAQLIEDGSTIQASMGNSPQAVLNALSEHEHLGIHTGCFTNAMMRLMKKGAVNNSQKSFNQGVSVASHCVGSQELYQFIAETKEIELHSSNWTNDPARIAQQKNMVAINGASEIDLTGQVVRDSRGHQFYGGIGATQDFIRGAAHSIGGRPIIALTSTNDDATESRIVTGLSAGSGVCTSRGDTHYVVTEYGIANLIGRNIRERVLQLAEVAHPKFREVLLEGARLQGWIPKSFNISYKEIAADRVHSRIVKFRDIPYTLRPLHPSDMRAIQELFYSQDEETIRLRYGYSRPDLDSNSAYKTAAVDQSNDLALGIFYTKGAREKLRATARFYRDENQKSAEISFLVHERVRRCGIANFLLTELAKVAQERGITQFWASVLKENKSMAGLFEARGATRGKSLDEENLNFMMSVEKLLANAKKSRSSKGKKKQSNAAEEKKKNKKTIALYASEKHLAHDTGYGHPESTERYQVLLEGIKTLSFPSLRLTERHATSEEIHLAHTPYYHDMVKYEIDNFAERLSTGDTAVSEDSYEVACLATGATLNAADAIMQGKVKRAFCVVRPPGHHATASEGMGFCIFNHAAIAARYLQQQHGLKKIAILDWDVHHGNGTQAIFYDDPSVFYFSTHQENIFPHTGLAKETGKGKAKGTTLNIPLPAETTGKDLLQYWNKPLKKALHTFQPDFIILSAGFDAANEDPLGDFLLTEQCYQQLTKLVKKHADNFCKGKLLSVLEGGYHPASLNRCVLAHLKELSIKK